ncbi:MAG: methionyl-tRNA formyltransferase [Deltaproteobacteria bacterium]|nr:methionyl-tRNA formyltransferase [Deltaproteobacteria bacterium]
MRLLFFGTPDFAVPTLERLLDGAHQVVGVVTQPDRPRGRGRRPSPSPVAACAERAGIPIFRPEKVGTPEVAAELAQSAPDLGVVVAFGQFLPKRIRELPARGYLINGHASLLPRHRGAAPIAHALLAGDEETGVSVMRVEREMDAGPVALMKRTPIGAEESCGELTGRIAALTAEAIAGCLDAIEEGSVVWTEQDPALATVAPKIEREDALLDWREPAEALVRRVRAMAPRPGAFTRWEGEPLRILAATDEAGDVDRAPGTVRRRPVLAVATGRGWLLPRTLQRAGGKALATEAFLRGRDLPDGTLLGPGDEVAA